MIEIIVIWRLVGRIGRLAEQKGLKKIGYQIMAGLLWLCGEFLGGLLGNLFFGSASSFWFSYVTALGGAIAGAGIAFLIMRLVPPPVTASNQNDNEATKEMSPLKKLGRSNWLPLLVVLLAGAGLCACFGVAVIVQMRSFMQQIHASTPMIGGKVENRVQFAQPGSEITPQAEAIYFSFYFDMPPGAEMPITFDWYIDGHLAYIFEKNFGPGQVVVMLDRQELGVAEFQQGNYEVIAHIGELLLTSAKFKVK